MSLFINVEITREQLRRTLPKGRLLGKIDDGGATARRFVQTLFYPRVISPIEYPPGWLRLRGCLGWLN